MTLEDLQFKDLVDLKRLQPLLDALCASFGVAAAIIDLRGDILLAANWQPLCQDFHRRHPDAGALCRQSDVQLTRRLEDGDRQVIYTCHHGLTDMASPIMVRGRHMANLFVGQVLLAPLDIEHFRSLARRYGFEEDAYLAAARQIPVLAAERVNAILDCLTEAAELVSDMGLIQYRQQEMHQRLQTSEQKVQKITGNIPGVIFQFRINQDGAPFLSYIGSQVEEIFGFIPDPNDPVVSTMARLHQEDRSGFLDSVMTAIRQRTAWSYEGRVLMPDGRVKWFLGRASAPAEQCGELVFDGLFWDITDRKKIEEQLRREQERAQRYLDLAGVVLLALDQEGTVTLINRKGCEVLGYAEEEIVGKNWFANFLPADIVQQVNGVFIRMRAGDIDLVEHYENPVLRKDGQVRLIAWHNMAQRDEAGRIVQFLASGEDITERRNAELRLRASEERYRGVVDHIAIGVAMISPQMEILTLNRQMAEWFPGLEPGARPLCYHGFNNPARDRVCDYCPTILTLRDGQVHEAVTNTPSGQETRHYRIISSPLRDHAGRVTAAIEMVEDITEQRKMQARLIQSEKMVAVGQLSAGIAHEIKNPLSIISLALESLEEDLGTDRSDLSDRMGMIRDATERANQVIAGLLNFSRESMGELIPVRLGEVITGALTLVKNMDQARDIHFQVVLPDPWIEVAAERVLLEQVFVNLLINAVHVTAPGGVIRVSGELSDGQSIQEVVVRVADQGCGISTEHLSRVFDPFFTTKPQGEGTGLGLSVVYMVINKLGGKIQVDSRPGEGTEFILTLPLKV